MNSIKNLFVVIMLMGVSYGAYQVISTPGATEPSANGIDLLFPVPPTETSPPLPIKSEAPAPEPQHKFAQAMPSPDLEIPDVPMPSPEPPPMRPTPDPMALDSEQGFEADPNPLPPPPAPSREDVATNQSPNAGGGNFQPNQAGELSPVIEKPIDLAEENATPNINWEGIQAMVNRGDIRNALKTLSSFYNADLSQAQKLQMLEWLDSLAGKVIYSTEHLLRPNAYVVQANDTLDSIAQKWNVPPQLIFNVNSNKIGTPSDLIPGTELKIIEGPFNAEINLESQELTLFLQGMYAGRFNIEIGQDGQGIDHGSFIVEQKSLGQIYSVDGQSIEASAPENPYGKYWIGLNCNASIHESNPTPGQVDTRGSIRLATRDAADVFGILSNGSQVTIKR